MIDIIFENREKRYGAYFLRKNQHWHEWIALALVCGWIWGAFWGWNWMKTEPLAKEKERERTWCCLCIFPPAPPLSPPESYQLRLPPCPPSKCRVMFKIPQPAPSWMLCECGGNAELEAKKIPAKLKNHRITLVSEEMVNPLDTLIREFPGPADVTFDSIGLVKSDGFPVAINEPAQLLNPEILPPGIFRKIENQKLSLSIRIDPSGNYIEHRLEGRLSKRLQAKLDEFAKDLKFTPEIREGVPGTAWVDL